MRWFVSSSHRPITNLLGVPYAPFMEAHGAMVIVLGHGHKRSEFYSWTKLSAFHFTLMPLGKGMNLFPILSVVVK